MNKSVKKIGEEIRTVLSEAINRDIIKKGDFVLADNEEWVVKEISGGFALLEDALNNISKKGVHEIQFLERGLTEDDFADMPMANPLESC
jgi:hypothetical protein